MMYNVPFLMSVARPLGIDEPAECRSARTSSARARSCRPRCRGRPSRRRRRRSPPARPSAPRTTKRVRFMKSPHGLVLGTLHRASAIICTGFHKLDHGRAPQTNSGTRGSGCHARPAAAAASACSRCCSGSACRSRAGSPSACSSRRRAARSSRATSPIVAQAERATLRCGADQFTVWHWGDGGALGGAAARLGSVTRRASAAFIAPLARGGFLGDRHRRAGAWHVAGKPVGSAEISRLPRGSPARACARACGDRPFTRRRRGAHGARGNRRPPPEEDLPVRRAFGHGLHPRVLRDDARARSTRRAPACAQRFAAHFGRPAADISVAAAAASVRMPVLVVHDEEDNVAPIAQGTALAAAIPHAIILAHAGTRAQRRVARRRHHRTRGAISCASEAQVASELAAGNPARAQKLARKNSSGPVRSCRRTPGLFAGRRLRFEFVAELGIADAHRHVLAPAVLDVARESPTAGP